MRLQPEIQALLAAQKPGWALERPFYTDPELFALESERLFFRQWLFVGHASRIPHPGDYFTYQVAQEPLLIIRDDDGQARALFNICRHKGSKICREATGNVKRLVCPYHQWVYEKDGALLSARLMPDDFDKSAFGLLSAPLYDYHGLLFICFADNPPPFPALKEEWIAPYAFEKAKAAHIAAYTVRANWKIVLENFLECYHCGGVHPEYTRIMAGAASSFRNREEETQQAGRDRDARRSHAAALGLDPTSPRLPFRQGVCTQSLDGQPVAPLMGTHQDYDGSMMGLWIGWTLEMEANPDHVAAFRFTPLSVGATDVEVTWLLRGDAQEGVDYDRERLIAFWKITGEQDWDICACVQEGVASRHYRPGPLPDAESGTIAFLQEYLRLLAQENL